MSTGTPDFLATLREDWFVQLCTYRPAAFVTMPRRIDPDAEYRRSLADWIRETHWQRRGRILANHRTVRS